MARKKIDVSREVAKLLKSHGEAIRQGIIQNMAAKGRNATGKSVASLQVKLDGEFRVSMTGGGQWAVMQRGRGVGKVPGNFRETIKAWVIAKGISIQAKPNQSQEQALNSFAYLVTRSIMQKGTSLHRRAGYDDIYDTVIAQELQKIADDGANVVSQGIDNINTDFINDSQDSK